MEFLLELHMAYDAEAGMRPRKKPRKIDDGLTEKTLEYLATQKDVWAERRNSGSMMVPKKGQGFYKIWLGEPGTPDVCLLIRVARTRLNGITSSWETRHETIYAGIETKCLGGKLNENQQRFHAKAAKWGMPICVAESLHDVQEFINNLRKV
jgi:hypothetical protein